MSFDPCDFCGEAAYKTNGNSESICISRAISGKCRKERKPEVVIPISRNKPCPCGSGKKHKHCCGKI